MTTTKTIQEDKLLMAARLMDEQQLDALMKFINNLTFQNEYKEPTDSDRKKFNKFLDEVGRKAAANGLTPEIFDEILEEKCEE